MSLETSKRRAATIDAILSAGFGKLEGRHDSKALLVRRQIRTLLNKANVAPKTGHLNDEEAGKLMRHIYGHDYTRRHTVFVTPLSME